ncbi:uncharacterized protein [Haliotis asinina]|uniref:uncharacterized protein isoform X2 n=1 Tax=Haliotis asinina TaxID=109174 RepID=UPI003531AD45
MASVSISRVKPSTFVLTVLILMVARHTDSTTSISTTGNLTFQSSCVALNWSAAEIDCINKGATIFRMKDLAINIGGEALLKAMAEHTTIWIDNNGTICRTAFNKTFLQANCSDTSYYVCKRNTSTSSEWYVPCREGSTVTSTQSTGYTRSTAQHIIPTVPISTVIASATCVIAAVVVVFIITGFYIIRRNKKPIRYAVRAESAMYHKQHPDPGQVEEPKLVDVQLVSSTEAGIGNGGIAGRQDGEYDILCGVMGRKATTSDTTAVYSHLHGSNAADDSKDENQYDTTTVPKYDRRPVDKIYDRLHVPDQ